MGVLEIILIGVGLAMDAFAASISKGLTLKKFTIDKSLIAGGYFGVFQGLMPLIGYFIGSTFASYVTAFSHWIAFGILAFIGINMIKEAFDNDDEDADDDFTIKAMIGLAIATSIDALSVGVEFSFEHLPFSIFIACLIIAVITFIISGAGVYIGSIFGNKFKKPAEITGGVILILIGLKILLTGFGILNF